MKQKAKELLEEHLGLVAGIILGILIVWNSIYAMVGLFLIMYILAPIVIWKGLVVFAESDDIYELFTPLLWLSWFVFNNVRFIQIIWG
jgi:hypothetical protein